MGPMMYGPYLGGMWMFFHFIFWILILIGAVLLIVWFLRQLGRCERGNDIESAMDILKKRYARGEINKEEYENMKKDIS